MNIHELQADIDRQCITAYDALCRHYGLTTARLDINWDLKGRSNLGQVQGTKVRLSPSYLEALQGKYLDTALHEVCHVVTNRRISIGRHSRKGAWRSHGTEWQRSMRLLGLKPNRTATRDEMEMTQNVPAARRTRRFRLQCVCQEHVVGPVVAKKVQNGAVYTCRSCRKPTIYVCEITD